MTQPPASRNNSLHAQRICSVRSTPVWLANAPRSSLFLRAAHCLLAACIAVLPAVALHAQNRAAKDGHASPVLTARNESVEPRRTLVPDANYRIGVGDVLSVDVWKEPELTHTTPVRPDGKISLPLLDDMAAAGLTPTQLATAITGHLREFLVNPHVTVMVAEINSRQIYVLGEVTHAGAYPMLAPITVMQALSVAGGLTPFADANRISVMRTEDDRREIFHFRYKDVASGRKPEQNIPLKPGDTVIVP
jgi:polysaccharide export outer membrane protein